MFYISVSTRHGKKRTVDILQMSEKGYDLCLSQSWCQCETVNFSKSLFCGKISVSPNLHFVAK